MISSRALLTQLACVAAIFVLFNGALIYISRNAAPKRLVRHLGEARQADILFQGDSTMAAALDETAFEETLRKRGIDPVSTKQVPFNFALGGTDPVEHLALLNRAVKSHSHYSVYVYGFFGLEMTDLPTRGDIGNRALQYYLEPQVATKYYYPGTWDDLMFNLSRRLPYIAEKGELFWRVEKVRRKIQAVGMPKLKDNAFGRASDFNLPKDEQAVRFKADCLEVVEGRRGLSKPVLELLSLAHKHSDRVIVLEMPVRIDGPNSFFTTEVWQRYRETIRREVEAQGAIFLPATEWKVEPGMFQDDVHLEAEGAKVFSHQVANKLVR